MEWQSILTIKTTRASFLKIAPLNLSAYNGVKISLLSKGLFTLENQGGSGLGLLFLFPRVASWYRDRGGRFGNDINVGEYTYLLFRKKLITGIPIVIIKLHSIFNLILRLYKITIIWYSNTIRCDRIHGKQHIL